MTICALLMMRFSLDFDQLIEGLDARLAFGLAALGAGANPLKLVLDRLGAALVLAVLLLEPLALGFKVGRIIALVGEVFSAIEFENPADDIIEEITVMGDHQHRAGIELEVVLQPFDALGIEVVGRFVEQQDAGLLDQQPGQRDAALFTAGKVLH